MQRIISKGLEEGKKRVILPLIDEFDDDISYAFLVHIQNENDARIITDTLCWSENLWVENGLEAVFVTLDYNDIITKHPQIIRIICNTRLCQEREIHLTI